MLDPRYRENIAIGMKVKIEESKNFDTEDFTEGEIEKILTKETISFHPHGILVLLKTHEKGHIKKIIESGILSVSNLTTLKPESSKIEYKETLLYSELLTTDPEKAWKIPRSVFKSIAGFANAEGGELWIGVNDQLIPVGLKRDFSLIRKFSQDRDGFELTLTSLSAHYFKEQQKYSLELFEIEFPVIGDVEVCKILVKRSLDMPLILYDKHPESSDVVGPYFYVRQNNSTQDYMMIEFWEYWIRHFKALHGINT